MLACPLSRTAQIFESRETTLALGPQVERYGVDGLTSIITSYPGLLRYGPVCP